MHDLAFVFAGFFVGLVVGLTGVGGGSLMTPILIFFFGVKPYLAVGTDLLFAAFTKMSGTVKLARAKRVDWRVVLQLSAGSIPAALITLYVLRTVGPASAQVQSVMTTTLGVALLLTAGAILFRKNLQQHALVHAEDATHTRLRDPITIAVGVTIYRVLIHVP